MVRYWIIDKFHLPLNPPPPPSPSDTLCCILSLSIFSERQLRLGQSSPLHFTGTEGIILREDDIMSQHRHQHNTQWKQSVLARYYWVLVYNKFYFFTRPAWGRRMSCSPSNILYGEREEASYQYLYRASQWGGGELSESLIICKSFTSDVKPLDECHFPPLLGFP